MSEAVRLEEKVASVEEELGISRSNVKLITVHGSLALGKPTGESLVLIALADKKPPRFHRVTRARPIDLAIVLGEEELRRDAEREELGGAAAGVFLLPYVAVVDENLAAEVEVLYKKHVALESLQNLILEHRLASQRLLINPAFFLYDKLRRLAMINPLIRPYVKSTFELLPSDSQARVLKGFEKALEILAKEGMIIRERSAYSPTEKIISKTLSETPAYAKISRELEHAFKLYINANLSSPIESIRELGFDLRYLKPLKLPEPSRMIEIKTALGAQPLFVDMGIREFIAKTYGVRRNEIEVKRGAGVLNSTYVVSFNSDGKQVKIFVKRYLNWTDFKWVAAWLWAVGVKNFSLLASIRMSNEIYFVNKLIELGFNAADILHVNWPRKIIFQKYIRGRDLAKVMRNAGSGEVREKSVQIGEILGRLHQNGISMGDCNPFSFIFSDDGPVYLVDLEQCSYDQTFSWDVAELLYYTSRYVKPDCVEELAEGFIEGYVKHGQPGEIEKSMDLRYARVLAPLTPLRIQIRLRESVLNALKR